MPTSLSKKFSFRVCFGLWFISCLVLFNTYTSLAITRVTSPLPLQSVTKFEELTQYRICDPPKIPCIYSHVVDAGYLAGIYNHSKLDFVIFSTPTQSTDGFESKNPLDWNFYKFGEKLKKRFEIVNRRPFASGSKSYNEDVRYISKKQHEALNYTLKIWPPKFDMAIAYYVYPKHTEFVPRIGSKNGTKVPTDMISFKSGIEDNKIKCGRRVYADPTTDVISEFNYLSLHYPWIKFTLSEERVLESQIYSTFSYSNGAKMLDYYKALIHSGIYEYTMKYFRRIRWNFRLNHTRRNLMRMRNKWSQKEKPIRLSGSIQTLFILVLFLLAVCCVNCVIFLLEVASNALCFGMKRFKLVLGMFNCRD
jgi:hypothetical protein